MDPGFLKAWAKGERLTAEHVNAITELLRRTSSGPLVSHVPGHDMHFGPYSEHRIVWVRNGSSSDLTHGQILCLDQVHGDYDPASYGPRFKTEAVYAGVEATNTRYGRYAVILDSNIAQGCTGRGAVSGEVSARINVVCEEHQYAEVDEDTDLKHLVSADYGTAHIIYKEEGTGLKWARLRLSNPPRQLRRAVLTADLYGCDTATATLIDDCTADPCECAGTVEITVSDPISAVDNCVLALDGGSAGSYLPVDTLIYVWSHDISAGLANGEWWFIQAGGPCQESSVSVSAISSVSDSSVVSSLSSVSVSSSAPPEECITCFNDVCAEDIPTVASLNPGDSVLALVDGCIVWAPVGDC